MRYIAIIIALIGSIAYGKIPDLNHTINDYTGLISAEDKQAIDSSIRDYFKETTNQLGVLVISSLDGENLENYSIKVFEKWKLGSEKEDNGILLLFVIKDRKFRIEVGQGLEGYLTDLESKRIQDKVIPLLRQEKYGEAILKEIALIRETINKNTALDGSPVIRENIKIDLNWSFLVNFMAGLMGLTILAKFAALRIRKNSIISMKDTIESNNARKKKFEEGKVIHEEVRKQYLASEQYKEDSLKDTLNNLHNQVANSKKNISRYKEVAYKYGVKI